MKKRVLPLFAAVALVVAGCATPTQETAPAPEQPAATVATDDATATTPATGAANDAPTAQAGDPIVDRFELAGRTTQEIVDWMDETNEHRDTGLNGSIRATELVLTDDANHETTLAVPEDLFYVSVAPYSTRTHDCFDHSLTGCVGEHLEAPMQARIVGDDGTVFVDGPVTTFENGFIGFWLPRDVTGTMEFSYEGRSVSAPFATTDESPTCITTMQLT